MKKYYMLITKNGSFIRSISPHMGGGWTLSIKRLGNRYETREQAERDQKLYAATPSEIIECSAR